MEDKPQNLGRAYLVKKLQERGCSRRQSVRILNTIFREMSRALARGEEVELPFGKLRRVERNFGPYWAAVRDTPAHLGLYTVEHELDDEGYLQLNREEEAEVPETGSRRVRKSGKSDAGFGDWSKNYYTLA